MSWDRDIEDIAHGGLVHGHLGQIRHSDDEPRVVAIDPGGVHCGIAIFKQGKCTNAAELKPWACLRVVQQLLRNDWPNALVIEEFRLYPGVNQNYSEMETPQIIGVLRWLHGTEGCDGHRKLAMQSASIKKPTAKILAARGVKSRSKQLRAGGHAHDAELHGHYYLNQQPQEGQCQQES